MQFIRQIICRRDVTLNTVFEAINGYLLLGITFSIFVIIVNKNIPGSYSIAGKEILENEDLTYYTFITFTSTGYGDIVPVSSLARSLSLLIAVSGQFYVAIIIALIVDKFSASPAPVR